MKLFTPKESKALKELLACAVDQDEVFSLESLHGFLFCLATIPEPVMPSEWLPLVFGEEMIEVADGKEGERLLAPLFAAYNAMVAQSNQGELQFPFDLGKLKTADLERIRQWCFGFYHGTTLRPEVWGFPDEAGEAIFGDDNDDEAGTEEEQEMAACMAVLMGVAFPEEIPELFKDTPSDPEEESPDGERADDTATEAKLFLLLPKAIERFQDVARSYGESFKASRPKAKVIPMPVRREEKIGRNDPCPCGSGKKYKKCCGVH